MQQQNQSHHTSSTKWQCPRILVLQPRGIKIERTEDGKASSKTIIVRIQTGRRVAYALLGASPYRLNGLSPETSINMETPNIMLPIMHGLETLRLSPNIYSMLAIFHQKLPRSIQHLPKPQPSLFST